MALTEVNSLGLKNSEVKTADIADENVTLAKLEHGTSGNDGKFLRANNGADPTWETVDTSIANDSIAEVKLDIHNAPSTGQYLKYTSNGLEWATAQTGTDPNAMPKAGGTFTGDVVFDNAANAGKDITWDDSNDRLKFEDNTKAVFGTGNDFTINHGGTNTHLDNNTGNLVIRNNVAADVGGDIHIMPHDDEYGIIIEHDGPVSLLHDNALKLLTTASGAEVKHTSGEAILKVTSYEGNAANLWLTADDGDDWTDITRLQQGTNGAFSVQNLTASSTWENMIVASPNGGVELYYDNAKKFETTSGGVEVTGGINLSTNLSLVDDSEIKVGTGDDLKIFHQSSYPRNVIETSGADFVILTSDHDGTAEKAIGIARNGGVELYHDNVKVFETHANGFYVKGPEGGDASAYLYADEGDDDADKWRIVSTTGGELHFENKASGSWEDNIKLMGNGGVNIYHDNSIRFQTYDSGLWFYGHILPAENSKDVGSSSSKWDDIHATNGTIQTSDRNEKTAIVETDLGLSFVNKLKPVSYKFNTGTRTHYGLIAQDVETTLSDISKPTSGFAGFIKDKDKEDKDIYGLRYSEFISPLIKAVQELSTEIETLKTKVASLEAA